METLLTVALEENTNEALLGLKALTNLAALPSSRQHMMNDRVVRQLLFIQLSRFHGE